MSISFLTPREIVSELDRHIVGQNAAKRAVAVALRNRWRRKQTPEELRNEIMPKNILMIGPTGVGKTEVSRRLAKLAEAPFLKVEATKYTEVGYVGRDVEQIVRDLVEVAVNDEQEKRRKMVMEQAQESAEQKLLLEIVGADAKQSTKDSFLKKLRNGEIDDNQIEIEVSEGGSPFPMIDIPGGSAQVGMISLGDMLGKVMGGSRRKKAKMTVKDAYRPLIDEAIEDLIDEEAVIREAIHNTEEDGIVFLDEIDKVAARKERGGADVSREGVQRDLLPLIEGTTVATKRGSVKTDHILFIASGAFHVSKPSDLLPELQGRLPIRVELEVLTRDDMRRILVDPEASLIKQYKALMAAEEVTLDFEEKAIDLLADFAVKVNDTIENIGARRLQTVLERLLDEISFDAPEKKGETFTITPGYVEEKVASLAGDADLSKFIL